MHLKKVKFPYLDILYLNNNHISDISCFENIDCFKLKQLYLYGNESLNQDKFNKIICYLMEKIEDFQI